MHEASLEVGPTNAPMCQPFNLLDEQFNWELRKHDTPFWVHALAGSSAGVAEHSLVYPLDTIKTRLQSASLNFRNGSAPPFLVVPELSGKASMLRLFRGLPIIALGCIPAHAALFSVYEVTKAHIGTDNCVSSSICGGLSTVAHDLILTPSDVIKQRLQLGTYTTIHECCTGILQREGLRAFYRSLGTILFMNLPFGAIFVTSNEALRRFCFPCRFLKQPLDETTPHNFPTPMTLLYFLIAGIAGGTAGALTTPLDVIKTRLQTQQGFSFSSVKPQSPKTAPAWSSSHHPQPTDGSNSPITVRPLNAGFNHPWRFLRWSTSLGQPLPIRAQHPPPTLQKNTNPLTSKGKHSSAPRPYPQQLSQQRPTSHSFIPPRYTNLRTTFKLILREEGWRALWKGIYLRSFFTATSCAICWGTYESVKRHVLTSFCDTHDTQ